jgi:hypothetical protein
MSLNLSPHEVAVNPDTNQPTLVKITPYVRLRDADDPPMFLQQGKVYSEGGQLIPQSKWPAWLEDAILQLTPLAQEEAGFTEFVQKLNRPSEPALTKKG